MPDKKLPTCITSNLKVVFMFSTFDSHFTKMSSRKVSDNAKYSTNQLLKYTKNVFNAVA
jgi:hypothetical protein